VENDRGKDGMGFAGPAESGVRRNQFDPFRRFERPFIRFPISNHGKSSSPSPADTAARAVSHVPGADEYGGFHGAQIAERIGVIEMASVRLLSRFCPFRPFKIERRT
jgi:hypothetical protein